jgi:hypothetical protein
MKDRSRVDVIYAVALMMVLGFSMYFLFRQEDDVEFIAFLVSLYLINSYELKEKQLSLRFGPLKENIPYAKIRELDVVYNFWSSMALSRKRIKIRYHYKDSFLTNTYISPMKFDEFYQELQKQCKHLSKST